MTERALPVVLIHGALRSRMGLLPTAWALRLYGLEARTFGYPTRAGTLEEHADRLADFLDRWRAGAPAWPVLGFLTHSMGGLVARAYLASERARAQSHHQRVVMLAPPNRGAHLAERFGSLRPFHWLYGKAATELSRERVRDLPRAPASAEVLILAGGKRPVGDEEPRGYARWIPENNDGLVGVSETELPGAPKPEMVYGAHSFLQWRPGVLDRAVRFLLEKQPRALPVGST
ncbi:MAG: hypothetical protein R3A51_00585 [Nannocystaceae bacterium]|nr:hypothetical protein [Myxococcales bacterium]